MQISLDNFKELHGPLLREARLFQLNRAHTLVAQQYCNKLTIRGACSGDCKTCGCEIQKALEWLRDRPDKPRMAYGIFGKLMKTAYANTLEAMSKRPAAKPETDALGEATERDALDIFMETLNA
jgi:hypothetical protein